MHEARDGRYRGLKFALTINGSSMGVATPDLTKVPVKVSRGYQEQHGEVGPGPMAPHLSKAPSYGTNVQ